MTCKIIQFPRHRLADDAPPLDRESARLLSEQIARELRTEARPVDARFDRFLSARMRAVSRQHWTPLVVAARAARWLDESNVRTVLDIGSGAGKFCVAAALAGHCHFTGLEHRASLVASARQLARAFNVEDRVHFIEGALGSVSVPCADAYYLYNPFEENLSGYDERIDEGVELGEKRYARDLIAVDELLDAAPAGTHVLIYNGFGGALPAGYREVRTDRTLPNVLRLWRKLPDAARFRASASSR
jgi:SAM-dependent methyltransferase